jgi:hypothetical protein
VSEASSAAIDYPGAPPQEAEAVGRIVTRTRHWEDGVGKDFHRKNQRLYEQYRGFRRWEHQWNRASANDRDGYVYEAKKKWGAELHIPMSFRTIETVVPRAIANAPKLLYLPRDEQWRPNVQSVQLLIDAQQEQIDIDLPFQGCMRAGQMYGLGVTKTYWDKRVQMSRRMEPRTIPQPPEQGGTHYLGDPKPRVLFDDPRCEDLDVFDFMWDPYGYDTRSCDWMAQKVWLTLPACLERLAVNGGPWDSVTAQTLDEDAIRKLPGSAQRYDEIWTRRMEASGFHTKSATEHGEQIHEVIEWHDGQTVFTVLDRQILVKVCENPCGEMPFQIYRPTPLQHQMVGIGALEPLEHLQRELDTLRSQRRDLVTLALCAGYAYDASAVDPDAVTFGPATLIEVEGDPRAALMPLTPREVPGSGFQEEGSIRTDIEAVSGLADALDNSPGGQSSTATEAQLVQASLGRRIELGARRFELEVVRHVARQFLYLDQREIKATRSIAVPGKEPEAIDTEASRYKWYNIGPGELEGEYEIVVEGGSMAARNIPQDRADAAQIFNTVAHDWFINPTKARMRFLELMGVKHPQAWLRDPEPSVPQATLRFLLQAGVDPSLLAQSVLHAREVTAPQEGPSAGQITSMGGTGEGQRP